MLVDAVLSLLNPQPGDTAVDCTAGRGGHSLLLARAIGPSGTLVVNDMDPANAQAAAQRVRDELPAAQRPTIVELRGNFVDIPRRMREHGLSADAVLADLGFASTQMEDPARGLSFMRDGPLDMRMDPAGPVTAAHLVNRLSEAELTEILRDYGEEPAARKIAAKLVAARESGPIQTTHQLASIVRSAMGIPPAKAADPNAPRPPRRPGSPRIDPSTRTFQALRIAVNDELGSLESLLESVDRGAVALRAGRGPSWLRPGARVGIIAFHSLEDRLVKRRFADIADRGLGEPLTRRPVEATDGETAQNPRSRSAKLRVIRLASEGGTD